MPDPTRRTDPSAAAPLATALALAISLPCPPALAQSAPGIVQGPSLRLAGSHTFRWNPSGSGGTVTWSVDRETVNDAGVHTRTNGILTRTGAIATLSLPFTSGSETLYYIHAADAGASDHDTVQVFPANSRTWFTYRSAGNPDVRVYCVIPSSLNAATHVVLAMHGNSRNASNYADDWRSWASEHDTIVLCPWYDLVGWPTAGDYQFGNVFTGDDCTGTLNPGELWTFTTDEGIHARVRDGFALDDGTFDLWGFSGGGQHVHRFMLWKPDANVRVAISAGSGWYTAPDRNIDCPYGLDDPLLDFSAQDVRDWTNRTMILMVGTADTLRDADLRVTAKADAQGLNRRERAAYMLAKARAVNPATRWSLVEVPGVGHDADPMAEAAQAILEQSTVAAPALPSAVPERWTLRVGPVPVASFTRLEGDGWANDRDVQVGIFDMSGRRLATGTTRTFAGEWHLAWSALGTWGRLSPGVYLVRATDGERSAVRKVLVLE